jgi:hypothetical protein
MVSVEALLVEAMFELRRKTQLQSLYAGILFEQQLALANSYDYQLILFFISLGITCSA